MWLILINEYYNLKLTTHYTNKKNKNKKNENKKIKKIKNFFIYYFLCLIALIVKYHTIITIINIGITIISTGKRNRSVPKPESSVLHPTTLCILNNIHNIK